MSNEKKNLINDEELKQVAGGGASFSLDRDQGIDTGIKVALAEKPTNPIPAPKGKAL